MDINSLEVIGGTSIHEDIQYLGEGVNHIVVGTPSRICDLISRNALKTDAVKLVIVHQTDVLLMKGFKDQFLDIMHFAHENVQSVFHSRTLPVEVLEFTKKHMREYILISDKSGELSLEGVKQFYVAVPDEEPKLDTLCDIYETVTGTKTVVFCNTSKKVDWLVNKLDGRGFSVFTVSNTIDQNQCNRTMDKFLSSSHGVLITTDISIHGINLQQVPLVINYDIPSESKIYIRRVGREGGKSQNSVALNFVLLSDNDFMADIERFYSTHIEELKTSVADFI
jgi:translation initiation factor 4A